VVARIIAATVALTALAVPTAAQAASKGLSPQDVTYLTSSIAGDRFEVLGGKMAASKTSTPAVQTLAARLVADHSKSLKEAVAAARRFGVKAPGSPTPPEQWEIAISNSLTGNAFDKWWSDLEVADHKQDIADATMEKRSGSNATIKKMAANEIPTLRTHLKLSDEALAAAGGSPVSGQTP
jgi:predicted outer membrane protein